MASPNSIIVSVAAKIRSFPKIFLGTFENAATVLFSDASTRSRIVRLVNYKVRKLLNVAVVLEYGILIIS